MSNRNALIFRSSSNEYYMSCFNGIDLRTELTCFYQDPSLAYEIMLLTMQNVPGRRLNGNLPSPEDIGTALEMTGKLDTDKHNYAPMKFTGLKLIVNWLENENFWSASDAYLYDYYGGCNYWQWWNFEFTSKEYIDRYKAIRKILKDDINGDFVKLEPSVVERYLTEEAEITAADWREDPDFMEECGVTEKDLATWNSAELEDVEDWKTMLEEAKSDDIESLLKYITESRKFSAIPDTLEEAFLLARDINS